MQWDAVTAITDIAIFVLLLVWMTMDRCNVYFRKATDKPGLDDESVQKRIDEINERSC